MNTPRLTRSGLLLAVLVSAVSLGAQTTATEFNTRGAQDRRKGDLPAAIADFTKAIELDPNYATAYNSRGGARSANHDLEGAIADFTKAIELNPSYAVAYNNRGNAKFRSYPRLKSYDPKGAIADFTKAIELNPALASAYNGRALVKSGGGVGEIISHASDYNPDVPPPLTDYPGYGDVRGDWIDLPGAMADFTKAIELDPQNFAAYSNRGNLRRRLGDIDGSSADLKKAEELRAQRGLPKLPTRRS